MFYSVRVLLGCDLENVSLDMFSTLYTREPESRRVDVIMDFMCSLGFAVSTLLGWYYDRRTEVFKLPFSSPYFITAGNNPPLPQWQMLRNEVSFGVEFSCLPLGLILVTVMYLAVCQSLDVYSLNSHTQHPNWNLEPAETHATEWILSTGVLTYNILK